MEGARYPKHLLVSTSQLAARELEIERVSGGFLGRFRCSNSLTHHLEQITQGVSESIDEGRRITKRFVFRNRHTKGLKAVVGSSAE